MPAGRGNIRQKDGNLDHFSRGETREDHDQPAEGRATPPQCEDSYNVRPSLFAQYSTVPGT